MLTKLLLYRLHCGTQDFKQQINDIGFDFDDSFTVLGFKINNKLSKLHENVYNIKYKMSNISNFCTLWENHCRKYFLIKPNCLYMYVQLYPLQREILEFFTQLYQTL